MTTTDEDPGGETFDSPDAALAALSASIETAIAKSDSGKQEGKAAASPAEPDAAPAKEETAGGDEPPAATEGAPAQGRSSLLDKVLAKYGGDMEKVAEALVHQWRALRAEPNSLASGTGRARPLPFAPRQQVRRAP